MHGRSHNAENVRSMHGSMHGRSHNAEDCKYSTMEKGVNTYNAEECRKCARLLSQSRWLFKVYIGIFYKICMDALTT
jgi:hypothetical protein